MTRIPQICDTHRSSAQRHFGADRLPLRDSIARKVTDLLVHIHEVCPPRNTAGA